MCPDLLLYTSRNLAITTCVLSFAGTRRGGEHDASRRSLGAKDRVCMPAQTRPEGSPRTAVMSRTKYQYCRAGQVAGACKQADDWSHQPAGAHCPRSLVGPLFDADCTSLVQCPPGLPLGALVAAEAVVEGRDGVGNNSQEPSDGEVPDAAPDEQAWVGSRELGREGRGGKCEMNPHLVSSQGASRRGA